MEWFAAHAVMRVEFKDGRKTPIPIWENIILLQADNGASARAMAESIAREGEGDSYGTFTWDERPAKWVFVGIRKVISCDQPSSGTEMTYSQYFVDDERDVERLAAGKEVTIVYSEEPDASP